LADRDRVVVFGLGRFGSSVATSLEKRGVHVLAVDDDAAVVQSLASALPHVVAADSTDPDVLRQLDIEDYQRAVVAIGTDIEASLLTTSLLSELGMPQIIAKATNPQHASLLRSLGAHRVVLPEHEMGERVSHLLTGQMQDYIELDEGYAFSKTSVPSALHGRRIGDLEPRALHGVTIVAVKPAGGPCVAASPDTILGPQDVVLVSGSTAAVEWFAEQR
jgi:trk system potassium uptake protein TrkA